MKRQYIIIRKMKLNLFSSTFCALGLEPAPLQAHLRIQLQLVCAFVAGQACSQAHQLVDRLVGRQAGQQLSLDPIAGDPIVADCVAPRP